MGKILPILLQAIFVAGGVVGGLMLKPKPETPVVSAEDGAHAGDEKGDAKKDPDKKKEKKKKVGKNKKGKVDEDPDDAAYSGTGYIKFGRQFIVPVIDPKGRNHIVMLDLSIEAPAIIAQNAYEREPKLRDALLSALFKLSNEGRLGDDILLEHNLQDLKKTLLKSAQAVMGEDAQGILILSIARQRV
ncbi:MAG: flagellar basal body-associated FliL family protein [Pseudomonadota bacterium]